MPTEAGRALKAADHARAQAITADLLERIDAPAFADAAARLHAIRAEIEGQLRDADETWLAVEIDAEDLLALCDTVDALREQLEHMEQAFSGAKRVIEIAARAAVGVPVETRK